MSQKEAPKTEDYQTTHVLVVGLDLGSSHWDLWVGDGRRRSHFKIEAGDMDEFDWILARSYEKFSLSSDCPTWVMMEAGRDGFWVARWLQSKGIRPVVVDPGSLPKKSKGRRAKTDRIDAKMLMDLLTQYVFLNLRAGWHPVQIPTFEQEAVRREVREEGRLSKEGTQHVNRLKGLLATLGIQLAVTKDFREQLREARCPENGQPVPPELVRELEREFARLELVWAQKKELKAARDEARAAAAELDAVPDELDARSAAYARAAMLVGLKGIGGTFADTVALDFLWRDFRNRKQVGGAAGLVPLPWCSGNMEHDQGIVHGGSGRLKAVVIQLAWSWVRWQPDSPITQWFNEHFPRNSKRSRKIGIVAVARKLLVALWRYVTQGVVPAGAV